MNNQAWCVIPLGDLVVTQTNDRATGQNFYLFPPILRHFANNLPYWFQKRSITVGRFDFAYISTVQQLPY
jgi:hypothetical protein